MRSYQLEYSRKTHNLRLKITPAGEVIVTAPHLCPRIFIDRFVASNENWIQSKLASMKEFQNSKMLTPAQTGQQISIFGKDYTLEVDDQQKHAFGVRRVGNKIIVTPVSTTVPSIQRALDQFLKSSAEKYILPRTHQLGVKMHTTFGTVTLRQQKSRWGSCSSTGNLNFNWRLVHAPTEVIDYVIIHELAHRTHMNHGAGFWNLVAKYDPEHAKHRGWLKRQGVGLG